MIAAPESNAKREIFNFDGSRQKELADSIQVPYQRINEIISEKRGVTPSTALRLAKYFGMSADFWLNLQIKFDLYLVQKKEKQVLERIRQMNNPIMKEATSY